VVLIEDGKVEALSGGYVSISIFISISIYSNLVLVFISISLLYLHFLSISVFFILNNTKCLCGLVLFRAHTSYNIAWCRV
jgi:hypothetical protein